MTPAMIGCPAKRCLSGKMIATANNADDHKRRANLGGNENGSTLFLSVLRSNKNSTQPAIPAEAVRPASPSLGSRCNSFGKGNAHRYPRMTVRTTRTTANLGGGGV